MNPMASQQDWSGAAQGQGEEFWKRKYFECYLGNAQIIAALYAEVEMLKQQTLAAQFGVPGTPTPGPPGNGSAGQPGVSNGVSGEQVKS